MAPDFKSYLVQQVIAENKTVSYRNVSRFLKVHVNAAKCMLYEFHRNENIKKPGSIYATYLISGIKTDVDGHVNGDPTKLDEDEPLPSSPPPFTSSMLEPSQQSDVESRDNFIPRKTITLAREEVLDDAKKSYHEIHAIHVYSISPGRLPDVMALLDIGQDLFIDALKSESASHESKIYGVIQNSWVTKRKGKRPLLADVSASKFQPVKAEKGSTTTATISKEANARSLSKDSNQSSQPSKSTLKKDSSNLFKAFAKQQDKPKLSRTDTETSTNASGSGAEDTTMKDADDEGESEYEALFPDSKGNDTATIKKRVNEVKREREDKAAKLRKMMESDDEDVEEAQPVSGSKTELNAEAKPKNDTVPAAKTEDLNQDEVEWSNSETEQAEKPTEPRRRRGKRKVMKKRTMKDEDGYLVTKEEAVWESFSEDEPEPAKATQKLMSSNAKTSSQKSTTSSKATGGKKAGGGVGGGGGIMNFFGKK